MDILFVGESGNVWNPRGREDIAVAGVLVASAQAPKLRKHVDQARRRGTGVIPELRYRLPDQRSKRFFFDPDRLRLLPVRVWSVGVTIREMENFREKHHRAILYEALLETLIAEVAQALGRGPTSIHVDPGSSFVSRAEFIRRIETRCSGSRVLFAPDSQREKGLQAADMVAGAARRSMKDPEESHWPAVEQEWGGTLRCLEEDEVRRALAETAKAGAAPVRVCKPGS